MSKRIARPNEKPLVLDGNDIIHEDDETLLFSMISSLALSDSDYTLDQVAEAIGSSKERLSELRNGHVQMRARELYRLGLFYMKYATPKDEPDLNPSNKHQLRKINHSLKLLDQISFETIDRGEAFGKFITEFFRRARQLKENFSCR